jgi:23S rRNA (pseudouridine1915-N3)-methyltransferase
MKFSDIERESWPELQPYVDTVLLPLSGLTGRELPWEATEALERLRDALDPLETAYKGRVVTYPAIHYAASDEALTALTDKLCERLYEIGFAYCVVVGGAERLLQLPLKKASALLVPKEAPAPAEKRIVYHKQVKETIEALWFQQ